MASDTMKLPAETQEQKTATVELPVPTAWPIVFAFGVALLFAGLVTSASISMLGAILGISGCIGWFREVLPHEKHESIVVSEKAAPVSTTRPRVARIDWNRVELHRARLPLEIYPISAGIKGGLAGGVVMAVLAAIYGVFSGHGLWFPINLLSAGFFPERSSVAQISEFHLDALILSTVVHGICSLLVGILYGATLPMFPRRPVLLGGVIVPIFWTGLLRSVLGLVDPVLNQRIHWFWFVISQIGFGVVAGIVVSRQERVRTWQHLPFAVRAGIETPGAIDERDGKEPRQ